MSIGILALMLSLAGQVFNTTIKSTGQATALTEVSQLLRAFEQTLRDDLRHVQPGQSMMLIQGNPVNAYWMAAGKAADVNADPSDGYAHVADPTREDADGNMVTPRADLLMFFTARKAASYVHTDPPVTASLQQVVYGHAVLGEYVQGSGQQGAPLYDFAPNLAVPIFPKAGTPPYPSATTVAPVPAAQWHLARRGVLLLPTPPPPDSVPPWGDATPPTGPGPPAKGLANPRVLECATDVVGNFNYEEWVLRPGDADFWYTPEVFAEGVFGPDSPWERSLLDPTPPAAFGHRLGHFLLPHCASFKVEWTLDPDSLFVAGRLDGEKEVYWFDPGDPAYPLGELERIARPAVGEPPLNLADLLDTETNHPDGEQYSLAHRFRGPTLEGIPPGEPWEELGVNQRRQDRRPNLILFGAHRHDLDTEEDIFPHALRITVDLYDRGRRLDRPIRHVMVVPVGG